MKSRRDRFLCCARLNVRRRFGFCYSFVTASHGDNFAIYQVLQLQHVQSSTLTNIAVRGYDHVPLDANARHANVMALIYTQHG